VKYKFLENVDVNHHLSQSQMLETFALSRTADSVKKLSFSLFI
jgi:hypothetical protein